MIFPGAKVYIFDMDSTLIHADCDVTWKSFAVRHKLAPESAIAQADAFYEDYKNGCLDPVAFMRFQLAEFTGNTPEEMAEDYRTGKIRMIGRKPVKKAPRPDKRGSEYLEEALKAKMSELFGDDSEDCNGEE